MNARQRYPLFKKHECFSGINEQFPHIWEEPHIIFKDEQGSIRAGCYFGEFNFPIFDLGLVPEEITSQTPEQIKTFAQERMQALIERERTRLSERHERIQNLSHEIELSLHNIIIKGRLTKGTDNGPRDNRFNLTMTEPFQLKIETHVRPCCFADGMGHVKSFDSDGNLLPEEIARQESTLIKMYQRELQRRNHPPKHPALAKLPTISDPEEY